MQLIEIPEKPLTCHDALGNVHESPGTSPPFAREADAPHPAGDSGVSELPKAG